MADNLAACVRELAAWPVKPAAVIVNGDLAFKSGLPEDYATFGKVIAPCARWRRMHLSLGNHDERENFWQAFPHDAAKPNPFRKDRRPFSPATARTGFCSIRSTSPIPRPANWARRNWPGWSANWRPARKNRPSLSAITIRAPSQRLSGLKDSAALEELFARHRQVKAFIFGHTHDWNVTSTRAACISSICRRRATCFKQGRPSGWVRATLARDGMEIELRSLDPKHPEHAQVKKLLWRAA